jgi:hypothetical protein
LGCAVLAHNLIRWTARLGRVHPETQLTVARTVRARLLALPGRLVNRSRRWTLRPPAGWPWALTFHTALGRIRSLPLLTWNDNRGPARPHTPPRADSPTTEKRAPTRPYPAPAHRQATHQPQPTKHQLNHHAHQTNRWIEA